MHRIQACLGTARATRVAAAPAVTVTVASATFTEPPCSRAAAVATGT